MSEYRRLQNVRLPEEMRDKPQRTSVSRTVREIRPSRWFGFSEIGRATVYARDCVVATESGKYWVILEVKADEQIQSH